MRLTREDVKVHTQTHATPMPPWHIVWHIEVVGDHYQIISRPDTEWGKVTHAFHADPRGWSTGADEDLLHMSRVFEADHWACIDRLLEWLSIEVEDGWSRPVDHVSHRLDLGLVDLVVLFTTERESWTKVWTVRDLAAHREAYRYDEGMEYDLGQEHPVAMFVRRGADLIPARYETVWIGEDAEVRVFLDRDNELVGAARY